MTEVITPSSLWQGTPLPGSRWTVEQDSVVRKEGRGPATIPSATIMRRPAVNPTDWTMPPEAVAVVMPRLAIARSGRVLVVTPAGAQQWLEAHRG